MKKTTPVVFGQEALSTQKGSPMSLETSRYLKKPKVSKKNNWREVVISEANLIDALTYVLKIHTILKASEKIERVIVGEPHDGVYPLSVAILRKEEKES